MDIRDYQATLPGMDFGDTIIHQCSCGNQAFRIVATFEHYEIATYSTDGECIECNARFKVPTPIDKPGYDPSLAF